MTETFTFSAYSQSVCPCRETFCGALPKVKFATPGSGRCTLEMTAQVVEAVGKEASAAYEAFGAGSFTSASVETFGRQFCDFQDFCSDSWGQGLRSPGEAP
eukprot:CAMPEP_0177250414 /NCGR_PEP_ID=MMETSP0367-20130122/53331_1 /TAXON_ID=447022 ORGANISM="Scrippsiella hangoei-like, Strain SHHI-4" /NCGR_SAMPLE_ID=MMETSP0367 /ASSEMBLY_ACC=CAM_ASM_000362 /LENGTH=100 /DNA_ID=CAMNT_0018703101 /DNA_START=67 /DNA_END=369 /DNA_ORIENTATION=-